MHHTVDTFAIAAGRLRQWAATTQKRPQIVDVHHLLLVLSTLYVEALSLPRALPEGFDNLPSLPPMFQDEVDMCRNRCGGLPVKCYTYSASILDPKCETTNLVILAYEVFEIYKEVITGLVMYDTGHSADATLHWAYSFWAHWGERAAAVIGVLHAFLRMDAAESDLAELNITPRSPTG